VCEISFPASTIYCSCQSGTNRFVYMVNNWRLFHFVISYLRVCEQLVYNKYTQMMLLLNKKRVFGH